MLTLSHVCFNKDADKLEVVITVANIVKIVYS